MTRLPIDSRLAVDRPDLPEYELNDFCPVTGEGWNLENHHIFRRSAGYPSWWVELEDGEVIGNRIKLSPIAHERVTVNKARIVYEGTVYYWEEAGERVPLRWQPPTMHRKRPPTDYSVGGHERFGVPVVAEPKEGEECGLCKRRVPKTKKKSSPQTKVFSVRVPVADAESFDELVDHAARHLGVTNKGHHKYWAIHYALTAVLQDESLKGALGG